MAKYKVGDKVRIVSERPSSCGFVDDMCKYLGTVMTIRNVIESDNPSYKMEEDKGLHEFLLARVLLADIADGWVWSEKWISGLAEEPKESKEIPGEPISVHIRFCGPLTVAELMKGSKVVKVANARCSPKDTYDRGEGSKVAVNRLFEKKHQDSSYKYPNAFGKKFKVIGNSSDMPHFFKIGTVVKVAGVSEYGNYFCEALSYSPDAHWQFVSPKDLAPYKEAKK
jgi:hypothetical protein|nr:MAG TPA: hypothetical protein [Caudoviricetes sp.]